MNELELVRDRYIQAREISSSYWKTVTGGLMAGAGKLVGREALTPDEKLALTRGEYERLRNGYIASNLESQEPGLDLGTQMADLLIAEAKVLSERQEELSQNTNKPDHFAKLSRLYGNPRIKTALSLGVNIGIAGSLALGAIPLTAVLVSARVAMSAESGQRLMEKVQDGYSTKFGIKSDFWVETAGIRARDAGVSELELISENVAVKGEVNDLYKKLLSETLQEKLLEERPETYAESLRRVIGEVDGLNGKKDKALITDRRLKMGRWAGSITLAAGVALLGGGIVHDLLNTPVAEAADIDNIPADTFTFNSEDAYFKYLVEQGAMKPVNEAGEVISNGADMSSLIGQSHKLLADEWGMDLPPVDPLNNTHEIKHFEYWTRFNTDYEGNMEKVKAMKQFIIRRTLSWGMHDEKGNSSTPFVFQGDDDIVWHRGVKGLIEYAKPRDLKTFIETVVKKEFNFPPCVEYFNSKYCNMGT